VTFDYEIENEDGDVLATLEVEAEFEPFVPGNRRGHPDNWTPDEGGSLEGLDVYLNGKDITSRVDDLYGDGTYALIVREAKYLDNKRSR
jgi:hypothetical protein